MRHPNSLKASIDPSPDLVARKSEIFRPEGHFVLNYGIHHLIDWILKDIPRLRPDGENALIR